MIALPSNLHGLGAPRLTEQRPTMPSKCLLCRRKYIRSGAYEKQLQTAHASLDIVLASTVQYNNIHTGELLNAHASECQDSDYESDTGPAGLEPDAFCPDIAYESDAEVFHTTSASAGNQNHFECTGEVIGDAGFEDEHSNLYTDPWRPSNTAEGSKLASWLIDGKVSKAPINDYFSSSLGNAELVGNSSMHTLENHLRFLDPYS